MCFLCPMRGMLPPWSIAKMLFESAHAHMLHWVQELSDNLQGLHCLLTGSTPAGLCSVHNLNKPCNNLACARERPHTHTRTHTITHTHTYFEFQCAFGLTSERFTQASRLGLGPSRKTKLAVPMPWKMEPRPRTSGYHDQSQEKYTAACDAVDEHLPQTLVGLKPPGFRSGPWALKKTTLS